MHSLFEMFEISFDTNISNIFVIILYLEILYDIYAFILKSFLCIACKTQNLFNTSVAYAGTK